LRHTQLINYALYQGGWFACVLGAAWDRPWAGFGIAIALLVVHLALAPERSLEIRLVLLAAVVGAAVETFQLAAGTYVFTSGTVREGLPPPWMLTLWAQFATTFRFSLRRVIMRPVSAVLFGAAGGPIALLAGERLGAVTLLPPLTYGLLRLTITWAIALLVFAATVRRLSPHREGPLYRTMRSE